MSLCTELFCFLILKGMNAGSFHTLLLADLAHAAVWSWFSESPNQTGVFHLCLCNGAGGSDEIIPTVSGHTHVGTRDWFDTTSGRPLSEPHRHTDPAGVTEINAWWKQVLFEWIQGLFQQQHNIATAFGWLKRCGWEVVFEDALQPKSSSDDCLLERLRKAVHPRVTILKQFYWNNSCWWRTLGSDMTVLM